MALKDTFRNLFNVDENEFEEEFEEVAEETERPKRETISRRHSFDRKNSDSTAAMKVVIVRPEMFDEVKNIADHLKQGKTVVLNLETANRDVSRRIVDFMSGAAYALSCKLKKIANNTFMIVPESTDIAGELFLDEYNEDSYDY